MHLVICRIKKVIDEKKEECWRQDRTLLIRKEGDVEPSTIMEPERSERKLDYEKAE